LIQVMIYFDLDQLSRMQNFNSVSKDCWLLICGKRPQSGAGQGERMQVLESRVVPAYGKYGALALAVLAAGIMLTPGTASALPSFARQTGQPCATCHTAFPELTPFGRQFKLGGYTAGGTRCNDVTGQGPSGGTQVPIAVMVNPTFTHTQKKLPERPQPWLNVNDNLVIQEASLFLGGQVYCNLGAFMQATYSGPDNIISLDNTDIRYARTAKLAGLDVLYGISVNNSPTVQDVWNTTPVWSFPFTSAAIAPGASAATMIEGTFAGRAAGAGAYVWVNRSLYVEMSAYGSFDAKTLTTIGQDPAGGPRIEGLAPYWRLAYERNWDQNSLMFGTFGMIANVTPIGAGSTGNDALYPGKTDRYTDIGVDTQYQYIGDTHAVTVRASYIWENQKLDATFPGAGSDKGSESLRSFRASASYIYNRTVSLTGGYFAHSCLTFSAPDSASFF
jgi:hypothetical protein